MSLFGTYIEESSNTSVEETMVAPDRSTNITESISNKLKELYSIGENKTIDLSSDEELATVLTPVGKTITKAVIISASAGCKN